MTFRRRCLGRGCLGIAHYSPGLLGTQGEKKQKIFFFKKNIFFPKKNYFKTKLKKIKKKSENLRTKAANIKTHSDFKMCRLDTWFIFELVGIGAGRDLANHKLSKRLLSKC